LSRGLSLATISCSCEYFAELMAFDEVSVRMRLAELVQNRMRLAFEYWRRKDGAEELVARGEQQIACMRREGGKLLPAPVPQTLREALTAYAD
jgi:enediyne biosynthesis thioesterase